jgi:hypothetical protein
MIKWITLGGGIILLLGLAASMTAFSWPTTTPTPTATAPPTGNILFEDDFTTYSNRWREAQTPKAAISYTETALRLQVFSPGVSIWSVPNFEVPLTEYSIRATVAAYEGGDDVRFGFVLQHITDEQFYVLAVSPAGEWWLLHHAGDEWIDLTPLDAEPLELDDDEALTHLGVDVQDNTLTLHANALPPVVIELPDDVALSGGVFGLFAQAGKGYVDVLFDDIVVFVEVDEP